MCGDLAVRLPDCFEGEKDDVCAAMIVLYPQADQTWPSVFRRGSLFSLALNLSISFLSSTPRCSDAQTGEHRTPACFCSRLEVCTNGEPKDDLTLHRIL